MEEKFKKIGLEKDDAIAREKWPNVVSEIVQDGR